MALSAPIDTQHPRSGRFKVVASCIVIRRGRLLMVQQGKRHKSGKWNLPGGKVDAGEPLTEAAVRETYEETGLRVRPLGTAGLHSYVSKKGRHTLQLNVYATVVGGYLQCNGGEIIDVDWFDLDDAIALSDDDLCKPTVMRPTLERLAATTGALDRPAPMLTAHDLAIDAAPTLALAG